MARVKQETRDRQVPQECLDPEACLVCQERMARLDKMGKLDQWGHQGHLPSRLDVLKRGADTSGPVILKRLVARADAAVPRREFRRSAGRGRRPAEGKAQEAQGPANQGGPERDLHKKSKGR